MASSDELGLAMRAGQLAQTLGWDKPALVSPDDMGAQSPAGGPLIVIATEPLSVAHAQDCAALVGAGRSVALVSDADQAEEVLVWLPPQVLAPATFAPTVAAQGPVGRAEDRDGAADAAAGREGQVTETQVEERMAERVASWTQGHVVGTIELFERSLGRGVTVGGMATIMRNRGHDLSWFDERWPDEMSYEEHFVSLDDYNNSTEDQRIFWGRVDGIAEVLMDEFSEL